MLAALKTKRTTVPKVEKPVLTVLCRTLDQIQAALRMGVSEIYADFEDIRRYKDAVEIVRNRGYRADTAPAQILLATPRIQKAGEQGFFKLIENAQPDGVLIRNLGALDYFKASSLRRIGDFSLNVANPLTAELLMAEKLERLTVSYDLNSSQVLDLSTLLRRPGSKSPASAHAHVPHGALCSPPSSPKVRITPTADVPAILIALNCVIVLDSIIPADVIAATRYFMRKPSPARPTSRLSAK